MTARCGGVFCTYWEAYQTLLIKALAPLMPEQLVLSAAPGLRGVGAIARHIVAARANWLYDFLGERGAGSDGIAGMIAWDRPQAPARSASELVGGIEQTWQFLQQVLASWTPAELDQVCSRTRRGREFAASRRWVVWHLLEHDLHHGGEISLSLGACGLDAVAL